MWDAFKDAIFICIEFFYNFVHDWGLAIVIVTLIFRLDLVPAYAETDQINVPNAEIQPAYAGDSDEVR